MRAVFCFIFLKHETVRPADTDKAANLAHRPKRLGTAGLESKITKFSQLFVCIANSGRGESCSFCLCA